jgi:plasmid maintenance system antidote protein VapI
LDIGKSTRIALVLKGKGTDWLAEQMKVSRVRAQKICRTSTATTTTAERLANIFEMKTSEFIALAEQDG